MLLDDAQQAVEPGQRCANQGTGLCRYLLPRRRPALRSCESVNDEAVDDVGRDPEPDAHEADADEGDSKPPAAFSQPSSSALVGARVEEVGRAGRAAPGHARSRLLLLLNKSTLEGAQAVSLRQIRAALHRSGSGLWTTPRFAFPPGHFHDRA